LFFFSVQLSEPTRYSDVFDYVVTHICSKESEDDYTIVLLVTDGGVTDFQETKEVLVRNSHMPISVVLVRLFPKCSLFRLHESLCSQLTAARPSAFVPFFPSEAKSLVSDWGINSTLA
jgi:hypothetical protein